jgi:hypothetical protein
MARSPGVGGEPRNALLQLAAKSHPAAQHHADDNDTSGEVAAPDHLSVAQSVITQVRG